MGPPSPYGLTERRSVGACHVRCRMTPINPLLQVVCVRYQATRQR